MNILVVVPWYSGDNSMGGVSIAVKKIFSFVRNEGNSVSILTHKVGDKINLVDNNAGMPVYSFYARTPFEPQHPIKSILSYIFYLIPTIIKLKKFINKNDIEIIAIFYPSIYSLYFLILKMLFGIKYVVSARGSDIRIEIHRHWIYKRSVKILMKYADALATCSEDLMRTAQVAFGTLPKRSTVIHTGIDPKWADAPNANEFEHNRKYIFTLASPAPVKGADIIIKAFSKIYKQFPDIDLLMAGTGPQEKEIKELIRSLDLGKRIIRLGGVEHIKLPEIYKRSLFGVIPSRSEGFSNVLLEFQLFGKAVLATNVGGLPEAITDGYNGYLIPPEDDDAMAAQMAFMLKNIPLCETMGQNGHDRVIKEFDIKITGNRFYDLFKTILSD